MSKPTATAYISQLGAYRLAGEAELNASPDTETSPGAQFLTGVRDDVTEWLRECDDSDELPDVDDHRVHEIADGAPDIYNHARMLEFVDLAAWQEDIEDLYSFDGTFDFITAAGVALYHIADRLTRALIATYLEYDEPEATA